MAKKQITTYKFVPSNSTPTTNLYPNARELLALNKKFIQEEAISYLQYNVTNSIPPYANYVYDIGLLRKEISKIIEGYISDLRHASNVLSVFNAKSFWEYGVELVSPGPEAATYAYIAILIKNYILTNTDFNNLQVVVPQVINNAYVSETGAIGAFNTLSNIITNSISSGISTIPSVSDTRGYVKFLGNWHVDDLLLITNSTRNVILYNFADPANPIEITYNGTYDSDFPGALYGNDKTTTIWFDADTSSMMLSDAIQILAEGTEQSVKLNSIATDAMERIKIGIPQSMLDADFEYGLQPTKWQTIALMRNYPSIYEIPNSDQQVISCITDASSGTSGSGSSLITVTTQNAHGFLANQAFTIKALAVSVSGFSRAEGSFLVNTVPTATSFTYYAKSKVGTNNGDVLSTTYTQLRTGAFYTGSSVGIPSFSVYSNGSSGTITTSLISASASAVIGFTGTAPPIGSPISGTGIASGTQITAVTGSGGTVATTSLNTTALINATSIVVNSTTGISTGLVIDRGDGQAITITNVVGNTISLSGSLTANIPGTIQTYTALSPTGGTGTGGIFSITRNASTYSTLITGAGTGYITGNTLTVAGDLLGGSNPANNATISITLASALKSVSTFDPASLVGGTGYSDGTAYSTTSSGSGLGLTVDVVTDGAGIVLNVAVNASGNGYNIGDIVTISSGDTNATITILTINAGGLIQTASVSGTPISAGNINFISAFTVNTPTTASIANGNTGISYSAISTIQVYFPNPHGFVPGNTITVQITSIDTGAQLAAGPYFVEQVPNANTILYTARAAGTINNTLTGYVYARPDSYFIHRPFDGGVQLGTGGPTHGATAIRMSKKYIRYQSGKGVMYNTGALFAPSYDIASITATGTTVGSIITITTDDVDHGCQVGGVITLSGVTTSGYNNNYTVFSVVTERILTVIAQQTLGSTTVVIGNPCNLGVRSWHGATVRAGIFDDQNGIFWQYDGIRLSVVKRSSTFQIAGSIALAQNSNQATGSGTRFTQQLAAGDRIVIRGMTHVVSQIASDTSMSLTPDYRGTVDLTSAKAAKTNDLAVPQAYWNRDTLDGNGDSGYSIDVTKMQMIGIQHTWYGAGFIDFMLRGSDGNYVFAHRFRNSNYNTEAYMRSGNQPVRYEVINEGAKSKLTSSITSSDTILPLETAYFFPGSGTVIVDTELVSYTANNGTSLVGCTRGTSLTQFAAGSLRTFTGSVAASHTASTGVILVSNTITPIISHWGSAYMIDGQFDSDRGYIFNYAATGVSASVNTATAFLIRLAPSVSNAQTGDLGVRELLNRAQMLLSNISITSDSVSGGGAVVVQGILNPINYPTDPSLITWTGLNSLGAGGQPSFAQIASGGSVSWGGNATTTNATVQGAFTTSITAKSFAPVTVNLTAKSFSAISASLTAASFAPATSVTYTSAFSTSRTDFLVATSTISGLTTPLGVNDPVSSAYTTSGQYILSITSNYITLASVSYTRIVMSAAATATSPTAASNGSANQSVSISSSVAARYSNALSASRNDFLVLNSGLSTVAVTDSLSVATYLTSPHTISSISQNYTTIAGASYALVVMSGVANSTSISGTGNDIVVVATSAATATYGSAISTSRTDFLITDAQYTNSGIQTSDILSLGSYVTGGQTISVITPSYITINSVSHTRIVMSAVGNGTSASGAGQDQTITVTAAGSAATYVSTNYLFFTSASWIASGATLGTKIASAYTQFPAGTSVAAIGTRTFNNTTSTITNAISSGGGSTVTYTLTGTTTYPANSTVTISGITGGTGMNGTFAVSSSSSGTLIVTSTGSGTPSSYAGATVVGATVYRTTFTQSSNTTISASATPTFQFGSPYALPGEQVFSFVNNPGNTDELDLSGLKEMTSTAIGGRGTFPNGPDVLAINVYKVAGTATPANIILRWSEAQA